MPTEEVMLTTIDNPFNPFTDYDEWLAFDTQQGYYSCNLLARFSIVSDSLSDVQNLQLITEAIDEVIDTDLTNKYIKVSRDTVIRPIIPTTSS